MADMTSDNNVNKFAIRKKWTLIPYERKDLPAIGLFFKALYMGQGDYGSMGYFYWKIADNYIQPGIINLIKDGDRIASTTSVTPKSLVFQGKTINVAEIGDTYTHPDYWRQGMFSLLINQTRQDAVKKGINFIYGTPNKLSLPGYQKKANFDIVHNLTVRSLVFPVDIRSNVKKRSNWLIANIIGSMSSIFTFIYFSIKNIFCYADKLIIAEEINNIPIDWIEFWNNASKEYEFIINRNTEAMTWRYLRNPNKYKIISLRNKGNLIGYLIYRIVYGDNSKHITIADFLTLPGEENALYAGINYIIKLAYEINVNQVWLWCVDNSNYYKIFKKTGFLSRGLVPIICYQNDFAKKLSTLNSWHFTIGDSDNI
jgi:hypothetical protein